MTRYIYSFKKISLNNYLYAHYLCQYMEKMNHFLKLDIDYFDNFLQLLLHKI